MDDIGDLQRYSLELDDAGQAYMELDPDGRYVLFKDVAARPVEVDPELVLAALEWAMATLDEYDEPWTSGQGLIRDPDAWAAYLAEKERHRAALSSPESRKP